MKDWMIKVRTYVHGFMERMRIEHHIGFAFALLSQGLVILYGLYVVSKTPSLIVALQSLQFQEGFKLAIITYDIVEFFYVFEPFWQMVSEITFLAGIAWVTLKALKISIGKPLPTIKERIEEIEESMYEQVEDEE